MESNEHSRAARNLLSKIEGRASCKQRSGSHGASLSLDRRSRGRVLSIAARNSASAPAFHWPDVFAANGSNNELENGALMAETRRHLIFCFGDGGIRIADADEDTSVLVKDGKK
ncbi:MAG TPA: hypothetical protein VGI88_05845 [Verrucomicrobiae bacterium]|jgi:hypothetical protein